MKFITGSTTSRSSRRVRKNPKTPLYERLGSILLRKKHFTWDKATRCARHLFEALNTPTSLGLALCIKYGDNSELLNHEVNPSWYLDSDSYLADVQACKFLSKTQVKLSGLDPKAKALESFRQCEEHCADENDFWRLYDTCKLELAPSTEKILYKAREIIAEILGEFDLHEALECCRFGNGAVAFVPHSQHDFIKLDKDPTVSGRVAALSQDLLKRGFPGWYSGLTYDSTSEFKVVEVMGGKHSLVPKKATTDRNIEIQPALNLFLQLGFGQVMRRRLRAAGVNLDDQGRNQELAEIGSRTSQFATIDLSNASDTISAGCVAVLLPRSWYSYLDLVRTTSIKFQGSWQKLHRFSSMGNGYTFELESLIFYALARAACGSKAIISVYGDDIIVPNDKYDEVVTALKWFGFTPNLKKSYHTGSFRESCGKDYFNGSLVRPFYLKELPRDEAEIIRMVNGLFRVSERFNRCSDYHARFSDSVQQLSRDLIDPYLFGRLAIGWPTDDSYLVGRTYKRGVRIIFKTRVKPFEKWFQAKTVMLYRLFKKYQSYEGTEALGSISVESSRSITRPSEMNQSLEYYDPLYWRINFGPNPNEPEDALIEILSNV
jgi:hypothetical protein